MEPEATVIVRPKDGSLTEKASKGAAEQFQSITGQEVSVSVTTDLSDNMCVLLFQYADAIADGVYSAGGVKLQSGSTKITLDNTLDERLRLLESRVSNLSHMVFVEYLC